MPTPDHGAITIARRRAVALGLIALTSAAIGLVVGGATGGDEQAVGVARSDPSSTVAPSSSTGLESSTTSALPATTTSSTTIPTTTIPTTTIRTTVPVTSGASTSLPRATTTARTGPDGLRGAVVVVDPGHNGANGSHTKEISRQVDAGGSTKDCNTTGTAEGSYTEAQFTWETAIRLAEILRTRGATVILTRTDNAGWGPCVDQRGRTAADNHADLMISIHADGASAGKRGFHVIRSGALPGYTDASTADRSTVLATTIRDALVAAGLSPSNYVGSNGLDRRNDLGTLNRAEVPAIMLESGNMHDATDLALLRSADGQNRIATALADGAARFLEG